MAFGKICNRNDKIWLAESKRMRNSLLMSFGKARKDPASRLATARYDPRDTTRSGGSESLGPIASVFALAKVLRVPVGYEDETGFHCGEPQVEDIGPLMEPENDDTNRCYF